MTKDYVVDKETALHEFNAWAEEVDLDVSVEDLDQEDKIELEKHIRRIVNAIQIGALTFDDDGDAVYTPRNKRSKHKEPLKFRERTGASLMATDRKKAGNEVAKMYAMVADMTEKSPGAISGLCGVDIKVVESLFALLME